MPKGKVHPNQLALALIMDEEARVLTRLRRIVEDYKSEQARLEHLRAEARRLECAA